MRKIVLLTGIILLTGCQQNQEVLFDPVRPEQTRVLGTDDPQEANRLFLEEALGENLIAEQSAALPRSVVVSVVCLRNESRGKPLFSVLQKKGDAWTFVRLPMEADESWTDLPPALNKETLRAGRNLGRELARSLPC